ncbi:folate/biopterin family MFS transporter [Candidatus Peregrinibacteria bacterium CG10_big_fil_rev_8_21_14_0_10_49_24]|nr:MAG: folate/biopterin family MFS transporter [Candidatus Peregrinibacteria bacterium CG11_big_fil_rev_8_21_14_0_20_49_14]PIR50732.1 MAG: folate/biopterin family MFS transporter [Candidatus Peregrinibacteria bacterium CG10_big_fil_rev_8_21_14_0_10_49_24]PJA68223.1 MAG: folate/biopterin family MFS transporter [Candidatus Peregrinibacteria bacterium CG_4_9_14_3_um_filter_49_12]
MRDKATNILIPFVYFIAGATGLASVASTFFYKEDLSLSIQQMQFLGSISIIPWSIKPIYGFLSDRQPIFKLRRKPYLFLAGLLGSAGYFSLALFVHSFKGAAAALFVSGMGFALADVIVDGIVAERSRDQKEAGKLQSICRGAIMTGALLVAYASGILVEMIGARNVYMVTGILPLFTASFALVITERPGEILKFSLRETWQSIRNAINPAIMWSAIFLFIWRATPSSGGSLSYFMIDELQFTPEFFGRLSLIGHAMGIVGVVIFRKFLLSVSLKKLLFWIIIASVVLSLPSIGLVYGWYSYLGMSPKMFAMADTFISGPLSEIAFLPLLVLVARVCPKGVEATMFALLASIMNIGLAVSDLGGAWLVTVFDVRQATGELAANYANLDKVLWIAILSSFLPMPLIRFLPDIQATGEGRGASMEKSIAAEPQPGKREIA